MEKSYKLQQTSFALWNKICDLLCTNWISMIFLMRFLHLKKKIADKSINPAKKFEKVSMPNLISAQHMRPVRELLKKWLSSLDFFAVHCCKVVTITLSCIFQRPKYWFYPFTYLSFSHKEWRRLSEDKTPRETFLWENTSNVCLEKPGQTIVLYHDCGLSRR